MPSNVPAHLSHLPFLGGLPVPRVVADHRVGRIALAPSTWDGFDLMTVWEGESGGPDFGKYDEEKQRRCVVEQWCHVCGAGGDLMVCVPRTPKLITLNGVQMAVVHQPWVCGPCLAYAIRVCPPLRRLAEEGRGLVIFGLQDQRPIQTMWRPADPGDPVPPPGSMVLSTHKLPVPPEARTQDLPGWAASVGGRYWRRWERGLGVVEVPS